MNLMDTVREVTSSFSKHIIIKDSKNVLVDSKKLDNIMKLAKKLTEANKKLRIKNSELEKLNKALASDGLRNGSSVAGKVMRAMRKK
ncbi:hypothetical protein MXZ23_00575 [Streptococcus uberis]|uniref:hypothetical protein n=1 Tax=Streptococcus uberis TaxID=1349 RepID=UPI0027DEA0CE|nr:hypothetical protein [Streptococcus uberis]MCK1192124.1 hypothetical protein [Streptococcus uberis]